MLTSNDFSIRQKQEKICSFVCTGHRYREFFEFFFRLRFIAASVWLCLYAMHGGGHGTFHQEHTYHISLYRLTRMICFLYNCCLSIHNTRMRNTPMMRGRTYVRCTFVWFWIGQHKPKLAYIQHRWPIFQLIPLIEWIG